MKSCSKLTISTEVASIRTGDEDVHFAFTINFKGAGAFREAISNYFL